MMRTTAPWRRHELPDDGDPIGMINAGRRRWRRPGKSTTSQSTARCSGTCRVAGFMAGAGTVRLWPATEVHAFSCAAGGDGCEVMVRVGSGGTITATRAARSPP